MLAAILPTLFDSSQRRCRCKFGINNEVVDVVVGESGRFFSAIYFAERSIHRDNRLFRSINRSFDQLFFDWF